MRNEDGPDGRRWYLAGPLADRDSHLGASAHSPLGTRTARGRSAAAVAAGLRTRVPIPRALLVPVHQVGHLAEHVVEEVGLALAEEFELLRRVADERAEDPTHLRPDEGEDDHPDLEHGADVRARHLPLDRV